MIFIGLDVSKISTALCIEKDSKISLYNYTTKKNNNIWVKNTKEYINYRHISYDYISEKNYSKSELSKLNEFDDTTDLIIKDIFDNVDILDDVKIAIEGYSYNSKGPIFDLIEFTTILKHKLMHKIIIHTNINIVSPMTLKSECCKMIYKPRIELKGKKVIKEILHFENNKGKQATNFDKWDMYYAFLDSTMDMNLKKWCEDHHQEIIKGKEVFKPLDDIIDAIFLKEMVKNI